MSASATRSGSCNRPSSCSRLPRQAAQTSSPARLAWAVSLRSRAHTAQARAEGTASTGGGVKTLTRKAATAFWHRSEEHTSELQSHSDLVCRLLLEKKKKKKKKENG